jgi:hypothetical protein
VPQPFWLFAGAHRTQSEGMAKNSLRSLGLDL